MDKVYLDKFSRCRGKMPFHMKKWRRVMRSTHGECEKYCSKCETDECRECNYGYWGQNCRRACINCWFGGCEKESGRCFQCEPGYFGKLCDKLCPENCWSSIYEDRADCSHHTGECLEGCNVGWWGEQCQNSCFAGCQGACYQQDGACVSDCNNGLFGRFCNRMCSNGCAQVSCDWLTGNCHGGCKCGYRGETCEDTCSQHCNTPCKFDDESQCLTCVNICEGHCIEGRCYQNGSCIDGCHVGFYGDQCIHSCALDCTVAERKTGCSCSEEITTKGDLHSSVDGLELVLADDEIRETEFDVEIQATGDGSVRRMSFVLIICQLGVQSL